MKNIGVFLSENFHFLEVKFSVYLNRHVFVMIRTLLPSVAELYLLSVNCPQIIYHKRRSP